MSIHDLSSYAMGGQLGIERYSQCRRNVDEKNKVKSNNPLRGCKCFVNLFISGDIVHRLLRQPGERYVSIDERVNGRTTNDVIRLKASLVTFVKMVAKHLDL